MPVLIIILLIVIIVYGPVYWARYVLKKYNRDQYFSGTGIDLARMLLERMNMQHVKVEETELGDHYDPEKRIVRLSRENGRKKSLTAVVVAAHEVGHAIQAHTGYRPLLTRNRMITTAQKMERLGAILMLVVPLITVITRVPGAGFLILIGAVINLCVPLAVHLITLPVEFDASRRAKELLLRLGLIQPGESAAVSKVLNAAAMTYVASMVTSVLQLVQLLLLARGRD